MIKPDGTMGRRPYLKEFAKTHEMPYFTIAELQEYVREFHPNI